MILLVVVAALIISVSGEPRTIYSRSLLRQSVPEIDVPECKDVVKLNSGPTGLRADVDIPFDGKPKLLINVTMTAQDVNSLVEPLKETVLNPVPVRGTLKARFYLARTNAPDISAIQVNGKVVCQDNRPKARFGIITAFIIGSLVSFSVSMGKKVGEHIG